LGEEEAGVGAKVGNPRLVDLLDHCIAEFEKYLEEQISDLVAAHAGSSLYTAEDASEELWSIRGWLEDLRVLRKKVIAGETARGGNASASKAGQVSALKRKAAARKKKAKERKK
jgi:hypothetical protein